MRRTMCLNLVLTLLVVSSNNHATGGPDKRRASVESRKGHKYPTTTNARPLKGNKKQRDKKQWSKKLANIDWLNLSDQQLEKLPSEALKVALNSGLISKDLKQTLRDRRRKIGNRRSARRCFANKVKRLKEAEAMAADLEKRLAQAQGEIAKRGEQLQIAQAATEELREQLEQALAEGAPAPAETAEQLALAQDEIAELGRKLEIAETAHSELEQQVVQLTTCALDFDGRDQSAYIKSLEEHAAALMSSLEQYAEPYTKTIERFGRRLHKKVEKYQRRLLRLSASAQQDQKVTDQFRLIAAAQEKYHDAIRPYSDHVVVAEAALAFDRELGIGLKTFK